MSTRLGGVSQPPFDSLNLRPAVPPGDALDDPAHVLENQRRFAHALGAVPVWLNQVHGAEVVRLQADDAAPGRPMHRADAAVTTLHGLACTVLVADCLPVLMCSQDGRAVGAAHAGWRGLAAGVLENTLALLCQAAGCAPSEVQAWLGACIGPREFEVGADVLQAFDVDPHGSQGRDQDAAMARQHFKFRPRADGSPRWHADLAGLARDRLQAAGIGHLSGGGCDSHWCTVEHGSSFFSYRRDGRTGRMAAGIAIGA